ncbi:hypothetical protein AVEN_77304-1 [Araneus ventricosus]|uniref:Uncharacterized protein n=1 Tax=Araneus ventricosus TaxID=182803 RepID=A0A4Y2NQ97_ARAVE|nr:hypothetical protein AVEN_77304-1 [Araneus ventricosus]
MFILSIQIVLYDAIVTGYVPHVSLPCPHTMAVALTSFDQRHSRSLTELYPTVRIVLYQILQHLQLVWVPLISREMLTTLLWLIPICAGGLRVPFVGHLAIAASTCVDVTSSVDVFGLPDFLHRRQNLSF